MDSSPISQTPFAALTFIVAPALLTNASSLLANSVTLRFLRTRDIMRDLYHRSRQGDVESDESELMMQEVDRVQRQAGHLLWALYSVYVALGSFGSATLITLVAICISVTFSNTPTAVFAIAGVGLGAIGVGGLVVSSVNLIQATKISLSAITLEAESVRNKALQISGRAAH